MCNIDQSFETLIDLYKSIYSCTFEAGVLINSMRFDELNVVLEKRGELISKADSIIASCKFSAEQNNEILNLKAQIKLQDNKNMTNIQIHYEEVKKEMNSTAKEKKMVSAYKISGSVQSHIVDSRE